MIRVFLVHVRYTLSRATAATAALLLLAPCAASAQTALSFEFINGRWWFNGEFVERRMYAVQGVFSTTHPGHVDSVVDLSGLYAVPPFAEAHTHTIAYVKTRIDEFIEQGVFYAMVMNVDRSSIAQNFTWFNRVGTVDLNFTAAAVTASDGHPIQIGMRNGRTVDQVDGDWITVVETQQDLEQKWPALAEANPDFIKTFLVYSERYSERHGDATIAPRLKGMDPSLLLPLVRRAHEAGLRVATHVRTGHDFRVAVEAGVDIIAHLPGFAMGLWSRASLQNATLMAEAEHPEWFRIRPQDAATAAAKRVTVIPTIGALSPLPSGNSPEVGAVAHSIAARRAVIEHNLRVLHEHGVRIAIGSDAGEGSPVTEALVMQQLELFSEAELLTMLTEHAARVTFPRRAIGRLADGYEASFIALAGDPTVDFTNIREVRYRFKQGSPLVVNSQ